MKVENIEKHRAKHADRAYTKPRLKEEFGLRPKRGQSPAGEFLNCFRTTCYTYRVSDCVPIKKRAAPSERQLENQKCFAEIARAKSVMSSSEWAARLPEDSLVIELATTDLLGGEEFGICEFWVADLTGKVLMHQLCNPLALISEDARWIHGHTNEKLKNCVTVKELFPAFVSLIEGKPVVAWSDFDKYAIDEQAKKLCATPKPLLGLRGFTREDRLRAASIREHLRETINPWSEYFDVQWCDDPCSEHDYGVALCSVTNLQSGCAKEKGEAVLDLILQARKRYQQAQITIKDTQAK